MIGNKILLRYLINSNSLVFRYFVITKKEFNEQNCLILPLTTNRLFHIAQNLYKEEETKKSNTLMISLFENAKEKRKETFIDIIRIYEQEKYKRGQIAFIKLALKYMKDYGINKDIEVYKALLNIFPKGPYIPKNYFNVVFKYYPKHQDTAIDLLQQMEDNNIIPDEEIQDILLNIFGKHGRPLKKLWRMLYWMPKFKNLNPWPVPIPVPTDPKILARIAIQKISSVDVTTLISEFETKDIEESIEDTWIISAMSPIQKDLVAQHFKLRKDLPMYVEGPFKIWIANQSVDYFILRSDPEKSTYEYEDPDDVSKIKIPFWKTNKIVEAPTVHEQEDGVYFAICATGTSSKDSAVSWIRHLQKNNPVLEKILILIKLASSVETECIQFTKEQKNLQKKLINNKNEYSN
ncbi:evolutionarily conserved signaling intermediate in Toll pathway, mitochondrial [Vespa velutina]|uniref:evolutionarily conserved signaling intermediate in Toll pathway, mitochondrial n=1 Tax=Vespa velutina TaxID=202808 RepID=UPI001FB353B1|nr:evolutionarily conserved signaling intermediate in Toll pathway, mitochondrial [Vespa velutina]